MGTSLTGELGEGLEEEVVEKEEPVWRKEEGVSEGRSKNGDGELARRQRQKSGKRAIKRAR